MWCQRLMQSILTLGYYNALLTAVFASRMDFNTWQLHPSRIYTIYCAVMHLVYLGIVPFTYTSYIYKRSYMSGILILQWAYTVTNASRIFAIITYVAVYWIRRAALLACCKSVQDFRWRYRDRLSSNIPRNMQVKQKIEMLMFVKYCSTNVNTFLVGSIFFCLSSIKEVEFLHSTVISSLLALFLATIGDQFCNLMTQLLLQFECVNQSLFSVILQLKALDRALSLDASELLVRQRARSLQRHLTELNGMHNHCFRITQRFFKIWDLVVATITLKIILTNIYNLYHAFLFRNRSLKIDSLTYLNGFLLTVAFYVDTILQIRILDALLKAGNKAGMMLHECGNLLYLQRCVAVNLTQSLEQFSLELTCRRLNYSICGLFNLDRKVCAKCLVVAIVQVTVLMQCDLKSKITLK